MQPSPILKNRRAEMVLKHQPVRRIIVHAGANDVYKEQYCLQEDLKELVCALNKHERSSVVHWSA